MSTYAKNTGVSPEKTLVEIMRTLKRYGAKRVCSLDDDDEGGVSFIVSGMPVRVTIPLPNPSDNEFRFTDTGRERAENVTQKAYEQAVKQRWRALLLVVKAKLEAVESGISTLEKEFLYFIEMGNGQTVGEQLLPALKDAAAIGQMPQRLALPEDTK